MPDILYTFSRIEQKYLLTEETAAALLAAFSDDLCPDEWGESRIYSLYFDTANDRLIRDSLSGAPFKEKLRLRAYGKIPETNDRVYLEIKRKYEGVVTKRRAGLTPSAATDLLRNGKMPADTQLFREMDYFRRVYGPLSPAMLISCRRTAFFARNTPSLRLTFDREMVGVPYEKEARIGGIPPDGANLFRPGGPEIALAEPGTVLLEIKCSGGLPLPICRFLSQNAVYPQPFSKYGRAYRALRSRRADTGRFAFEERKEFSYV